MQKKGKQPFLELHVLLAPTQSKCSVFELHDLRAHSLSAGRLGWEGETPALMLTKSKQAFASWSLQTLAAVEMTKRRRRRGKDGEGILQRNPHPLLLLAHYWHLINYQHVFRTCLGMEKKPQMKKLWNLCRWCRRPINRILFLPLPFWPHFFFSLVFPLCHHDDVVVMVMMVSDEFLSGEHNIPVTCVHQRGKLGQKWDSCVNPPAHHGPANWLLRKSPESKKKQEWQRAWEHERKTRLENKFPNFPGMAQWSCTSYVEGFQN